MNLIFDMDDTIAALYAVPNWLEKLKAEDESPYLEAAPMWDMEKLRKVLERRKPRDKVIVVSWLAKNSSENYKRKVRNAKIQWLQKYKFPYDEIHLIQYGARKTRYIEKGKQHLIFDDNAAIRKQFSKFANCKACNPLCNDIIAILLEDVDG